MKRIPNCKVFYVCLVLVIMISSIIGESQTVYAKKSVYEKYGGKLIIVGDSRTKNMSKWVSTSMETRFIAKSGKGYKWFVSEGAKQATEIANPGDTILVWLGVNDYSSTSLFNEYGLFSWELYANYINDLVATDWAKFNVVVASVGYIDREKIFTYYGVDKKSNIQSVANSIPIGGILEFNTKLRDSLSESIMWLDTNMVIGIDSSDSSTSTSLWVKRSNGSYDGLHYSKKVTQKVYNFFANIVLALYSI